MKQTGKTLKLYEQGFSLYSPVRLKARKNVGGSRGVVKGWSMASRRRMRKWLLTHSPASGSISYGVTFTIPGPLVDIQRAKAMFEKFANDECAKKHVGLCWRIEIQKRGSYHWHCLASVPKNINAKKFFLLGWMKAIDSLGCCSHIITNEKREIVQMDVLRSNLIGAAKYAVDVQGEGDSGSWLRYLQDHASKFKQEQIPENIGRHWGVYGRKFFQEITPLHDLTFESEKHFYRFLRSLRRLCTPVMSHKKTRLGRESKFMNRPFSGSALGWSNRRGGRGRSDWFSSPDVAKRIFDYYSMS